MQYSEALLRAFRLFIVLTSLFVTNAAFSQPTVNITSPANNGTVGGRARVAFTVTSSGSNLSWQVIVDKGRTNEATIRTGTTTSETFFWTTTNVTDGSHTLTVSAKDSTSSDPGEAVITVTVNNNSFIRLSNPADNAVVKGTVSVTGQAGGSWDLLLDENTGSPLTSGTAGPISYSFNTDTVTPEGTHTLDLVVRDGLGSESRISKTIVIDRTAPTVNITAPGNGDYVKGDQVPIIASIDDPNPDRWEIKIDGGTTGLPNNGTGTGSSINIVWNSTSYSQGAHTLTIVAIDKAGNRSSGTSVTFTVDNVVPTVILHSLNPNTVDTTPVTLTGSVSDANLQGWKLRVDGGTTGLSPSDFTVTDGSTTAAVSAQLNPALLGEGTHTVMLTGTDKAGNESSKTITIIKDNTAPVINLTAPEENPPNPLHGNVTITATIDDVSDLDNWKVKVDGIQIATGTGKTVNVTWNSAQKNADGTPKWVDGTHTITVEATDEGGHIATPVTRTLQTDNTVPTVEISQPVADAYVKDVVAINANISPDTDATYTVSVDGNQIDSGTGGAISTTWDATDATSGPHTIQLTATDRAGNQKTQTVTVRVDKDKPILTIAFPFNNMIVRPGSQLTVFIDVRDQLFDNNDRSKNSVENDKVIVQVKDDRGSLVATATMTKGLEVRSGSTGASARWAGSVRIRIPSPFRANKTYTLEATATDKSGNTSDRTTLKFKVKYL